MILFLELFWNIFGNDWKIKKSQRDEIFIEKIIHHKYKAPAERHILRDLYFAPLELFDMWEI